MVNLDFFNIMGILPKKEIFSSCLSLAIVVYTETNFLVYN